MVLCYSTLARTKHGEMEEKKLLTIGASLRVPLVTRLYAIPTPEVLTILLTSAIYLTSWPPVAGHCIATGRLRGC